MAIALISSATARDLRLLAVTGSVLLEGAVVGAGAVVRDSVVGRFASVGENAALDGVVVGLVVGKPLGILAATALARRTGLGRLPEGLEVRDLVGVSLIAGIGFTVSLFVADLTFAGTDLADAKAAVLGASVLAALVGSCLVLVRGRA